MGRARQRRYFPVCRSISSGFLNFSLLLKAQAAKQISASKTKERRWPWTLKRTKKAVSAGSHIISITAAAAESHSRTEKAFPGSRQRTIHPPAVR